MVKISRKRRGSLISILVLAGIIVAVYFIYSSPHFEREKPRIEVPSLSFWNLKWHIPVKLNDKSGIKNYRVIFIDSEGKERLLLSRNGKLHRDVEFFLPLPKISFSNGDKLKYRIEATDGSKYRFFLGNKASVEFDITLDTQQPDVRIIAMSNKITKGGSAVVVFYANDENLANISLSNGFQSFVAFPFLKEHYYISIIPWSIHNPTFRGLITVQDKAGNVRKSSIRFAKYFRNYRNSNLNIDNRFIDGKIAEIIENVNEIPLERFTSRLEMFRYVNETIRKRDESFVNSKILNIDLEDFIDNIRVFKPLKDSVVVGLYGDHRRFIYERQNAGESYHLGIDLVNVKNAPVIASNDGVVVLSSALGVYGNTIAIDHGLGITSLYSHLSEIYVKEGQVIHRGDIIGRTGVSGLAFGDHLHFGVLVQGVFSLSTEWLDTKWLQVNVSDIISDAKRIIEAR